jgi:hypothetical protein
MTQRTRIVLAIAALAAMVLGVLGVDALRRRTGTALAPEGEPTLLPGSIPIYLDGRLVGGFQPTDLQDLQEVSFVDTEDGVAQQGWLLRDVLQLHIDVRQLKPDNRIEVSSSSRNKAAELTWSEVEDAQNWVMFDLSNRGTLKLVSVLEKLDTREEWVQDTDRIEVTTQ